MRMTGILAVSVALAVPPIDPNGNRHQQQHQNDLQMEVANVVVPFPPYLLPNRPPNVDSQIYYVWHHLQLTNQ
jgi:hypothetical protein